MTFKTMTWERIVHHHAQAHLLDGYVEAAPCNPPLNGSRAPNAARESLAANYDLRDIIFAVTLRFRRKTGHTPCPALTREFARDAGPTHYACLVVAKDVPQVVPAIEFLMRATHFQLKKSEQYQDYAAYRRDVDGLLHYTMDLFFRPSRIVYNRLLAEDLRPLVIMESGAGPP